MKKIFTIKLKELRNEAHYQYLSIYRDLMLSQGVVSILPEAVWNAFSALLEKEHTLLDADRSSDLTKLLSEADARQDRDLIGIHAVIIAGLHHYNPEIAEAARSLNERFHDFKKISEKPYEEEAAAIMILLEAFNGAYAPQAALLNLQGWITDLAAANAEFQQLYMQRSAQTAAKPEGRFVDVRREIATVYRQTVTFIDAALVLNPTYELDSFMHLINAQIVYFNEHAHHTTKKNLAAATFDIIPPQAWNNDQPVTPLPVLYFNGQTLAFARDYVINYRNNSHRGTAIVVITGKGLYTGQREIPFNIV